MLSPPFRAPCIRQARVHGQGKEGALSARALALSLLSLCLSPPHSAHRSARRASAGGAALRTHSAPSASLRAQGLTVIRLVSQAGTGYFYTKLKNLRAGAEKLLLLKYDPVVNARVLFKEERIKK